MSEYNLKDDVFKKEYEEFKLTLRINADDTELLLKISTKTRGISVKPQIVLDFINALKLTGTIDNKSVSDACLMAISGKDVDDITVMICNLETPNQSARLELYKKSLTIPEKIMNNNEIEEMKKKPGEESIQKDYHNLNLFENIKLGEAVAKSISPKSGEKGISLRGDVLIPEKANEDFKYILGENVRLGVAGREGETPNLIIAKKNGMLLYDEKTHVIAISELYEINGDVGYNTGNIDFIGSVSIKGDVINTFDIVAGKDILIKGHIESSKIIAGGTLEFGGVSASNEGLLQSQGNMVAKYIDAANIICYNNLEVKNEIIDSEIKVRGRVEVTKGSIIGGKVTALGGIESRMLGSEVGMKTKLIAGICFISNKKIENINKNIKENLKQLEKISKIVDPMIGHPEITGTLSKEKKLELRKLMTTFTELNLENLKLSDKIKDIEEEVKTKANPIISVWKTLHPNVRMTLNKTIVNITKPIVKKMTIIPNSRNPNYPRYMDYIPLTENSLKIEREVAKLEIAKEKEKKE